MEYALPAEARRVSPSLRSGTFIDFGVTKTQAFTGKVLARVGGAAKAVEYQEIEISIDHKARRLPTGRGGEFYVENLKPGRYPATVMFEGKPCALELNIPKSDETFVDLGDVTCTRGP